jgi:hypothetical protein
MATYTVHQPPLRDDEMSSDPGRFAFVRDGFHFWAFVFGPVWMLRHRLWLVLLLYVVVVLALGAVLWFVGASYAAPFVQFLLALLIGIEAASLRRWTLTRRGWDTLGVVVGDDLETAERRFFDAWTAEADVPSSPPLPNRLRSMQPAPPRQPDVIGLFPEPGTPR